MSLNSFNNSVHRDVSPPVKTAFLILWGFGKIAKVNCSSETCQLIIGVGFSR